MVVLTDSPSLHADFVARHRVLTQSSTKFTLWHKDFAVPRFKSSDESFSIKYSLDFIIRHRSWDTFHKDCHVTNCSLDRDLCWRLGRRQLCLLLTSLAFNARHRRKREPAASARRWTARTLKYFLDRARNFFFSVLITVHQNMQVAARISGRIFRQGFSHTCHNPCMLKHQFLKFHLECDAALGLRNPAHEQAPPRTTFPKSRSAVV